MPAPRAVATTESPDAPILLMLYEDRGPVERIELSPVAALHLAADLLGHAIAKAALFTGDECAVPSAPKCNVGARGAAPR